MNEVRMMPDPQIDLAFPLMKALQRRRSKRRWREGNISEQDLSNLLWAACGETFPATKRLKCKRTAPSATNCQDIRLYVILKTGVYRYEERSHQLLKVSDDDLRWHITNQNMLKDAPLGLVYVADYSRMKSYLRKDVTRQKLVSGTDTGFISQNVYLYCAAANLSTTIIGLVDRHNLGALMGLAEHEKVVFTQVVGNAVN